MNSEDDYKVMSVIRGFTKLTEVNKISVYEATNPVTQNIVKIKVRDYGLGRRDRFTVEIGKQIGFGGSLTDALRMIDWESI